MPSIPAKAPPPGYDVRGQRGVGFWTLREWMPGTWQDIGGPYKERWYAVRKAERDAEKRQPAVRRTPASRTRRETRP